VTDYVLEMPQSGERIRGSSNVRAFCDAYPNPPSIEPRRLVGAGDLSVMAILEFHDGRIWRDTRWFANPLEAPAWRAQWVERAET
jgi:hypothetical protein